jgi:hypothetical protein
MCARYSGSNIADNLSYGTERGEGKMERAGGSKTAQSLSEHVQCNCKHPPPLFNFDTIGGILTQ